MVILNDTVAYKSAYEKQIQDELLDIKIPIEFTQILDLVKTDDWNKQQITEQEYSEFPFLKSNFKSQSEN